MIHGHRIPGGRYIGLNAWGTQVDQIYREDPDVHRPERWLIDDEVSLKAMYKTHELIFGHGSTMCLDKLITMRELYKMNFEV